jgi:hypothetical protein
LQVAHWKEYVYGNGINIAFIKRRDNGKIPTKMSACFLAMRFASSVRMHRSKNSRPICINTNLKLLKILKNGNYIATTGIK